MSPKQDDIAIKNKIGVSELIQIKRMKPYIKPTKPHKHKGYNEIILITKGEGFHSIEFNSYTIQPPMIFSLMQGQIHHWEFTEKPDGYVLMFKPEFMQEFHQLNSNRVEIDESIVLNEESCHSLEYILNAIATELNSKDKNHKQAIASYLNVLLIQLSRLSGAKDEKRSVLASTYQKFNILIEHHFRTTKKVQEYAEMLHISPKHLNEISKKNTGKTASAIIQEHVITEAKRGLIHTDKSISELSLELGFEDSSHFAKFFKVHVGSSPKSFRSNRFH